MTIRIATSEAIGATIPPPAATMIDEIAKVIAKADGFRFDDDAARFRRLAMAALKPLTRPTEAMVDAAYEAVRSDEYWAVNSHRDFRKAVRAMILAAMAANDAPAC